MTTDKTREARMRRLATRRGYILRKSRTRNPDAIDYGGYMLVTAERNLSVLGTAPFAFSASLDTVAAFLESEAA